MMIDLTEQLDAAITEFEAAQVALQRKVREGLDATFTALFAAEPDLTSMSWHQYVPAFNDGDPCVFTTTISYAEYVFADGTRWEDGVAEVYADGKDYSSNFDAIRARLEAEGIEGGAARRVAWSQAKLERLDERSRRFVSVVRALQGDAVDLALQAAFGTHVTVTARRDESGAVVFDTDDYDCGY